MVAWLIVVVVAIGIVIGIRLLLKRAAEQRAAHEARLRAMAQASLAAMRKKAAAEAAAAKQPAAAGVGGPTQVREERECPFCAEPILKKARVCKHCGRDVEPLA